MTSVLKLMHSPHNFSQPLTRLPFQKVDSQDGKDRKSLLAYSSVSKNRSNVTSVAKQARIEDGFQTRTTELSSINRSYNTTAKR